MCGCLFGCHFIIVQYGFGSEGQLRTDFMCQDCSFVLFYANMNCVHCIDGNDVEVEDNDYVMYLNF